MGIWAVSLLRLRVPHIVLLALSSATVFLVSSLAQPKNGEVVEWGLLGFPLSLEPPLALAVLYLVYIISCLLADNMILHVRDLTESMVNQWGQINGVRLD